MYTGNTELITRSIKMMKQPALDQKTVKKTAPVIKGQDFAVSIGMNPFDRMTLVSLDQLPESVEK